MDETPPYEILAEFPDGIPIDRLEVDFSPAHKRLAHPDRVLEASIEQVWDARKAAQPDLFNGSKFRYGGFERFEGTHEEPDGESMDRVKLLLGYTDYRTFVGSNLNPEWPRFLVPSACDDTTRSQHMSDPLGNACVVTTADGRLLMLQRGTAVGEAPSCAVFPGGHSEPTEVGIQCPPNEASSPELAQKIAEEMYSGIIREIEEETGVPPSTLVPSHTLHLFSLLEQLLCLSVLLQ
eukprot:TRINITY_DN2515_c0_g1_i3.p1 TRINITY_DN2515_c0_g1~~TRINITY_DN2515_c0_g1_i3.p1  ORF type:complete len:236 (-),score=23.23 TRINITY_DN2515_c0_g1_i3:20-727(-)